ncbi:Hypp7060 [Branchiostoma lanceolatum]|uniref:Hypp7060 protein n=1 Tax=Branchiostoma lanceolatum TaxID=7740 RepID=A0A8K0E672_BRALA|nr:Hypp7060 [Branchiostoma lanceolatum]
MGRLTVAARALPTPADQRVAPPVDVPLATVSALPHVPMTGALHPPLVYSQTERAPLSQIDHPASQALSTADAVSILCVATIVPILGIAFILYPCFRDGVLEWRLKLDQKKRGQQSRRQTADLDMTPTCTADALRLKNVSNPDIADVEWAFVSPGNHEALLVDVWNCSDDTTLRAQRRLKDEKSPCPSVPVHPPDTPITQSRSEFPSPLSPDFLWRSMFPYAETFRRLEPPEWRSHQPQNDMASSDEKVHVFGFSEKQTDDDPFKGLKSDDVAHGRGKGSEKRRRQFYSVTSSGGSGDGSKTPSPVWVRRRSVVVIESTKVDASSDSDTIGDRSALGTGWNSTGSGTDTLKTLCQRNRTSSAEKNDPCSVTSSTESVSSGHVIHVCADVHVHVSSSSSGSNVDRVGATGFS